jgi:hypothetical protein
LALNFHEKIAMTGAFGRDALLDAFDQIGRAAVLAGTRLQTAVYGGSALMLAGNFRFATEDVGVSELEHPLPDWLAAVVDKIARANDWRSDWFNDGVVFHLSSLADLALDHLEYGTFPRDSTVPGLVVSVPSAEYLLALKLKALRVTDPVRGETERLDILNLMKVAGVSSAEQAIAPVRPIFPGERGLSREAASFIEQHESRWRVDAPEYPR